MGWSFRKSLSIGGLFRLNFSKGGVGASVGVRGARVSIDPRGRTALNVGAGGVYGRTALNGGGRRSRKARGNTSIGLAVGVVVVVIAAFALLWPSTPKAKPLIMEKPAFVPMVAPPLPSPAKPVVLSDAKDETKPGPITAAPAPEEWKLKEGGISGTGSLGPPDRNGQQRSVNAPPRKPTMVDARNDPQFAPEGGRVWVKPYRKKDGTMVEGYWRER